MRSIYSILSIIVLLAFVGCNEAPKQAKKSTKVKNDFRVNAIIQEVIQTSSYTYSLVKEGPKEYWIAFMKMNVEKGQELFFNKSLEMKDFHSKELNRNFESVFFVQDVGTSANSLSHNGQQIQQHAEKTTDQTNNFDFDKVKGGYTIAELYANKAGFDGKKVKVRGRVVKFNAAIMGENWIHIQDGTASNGNYDLTITSQEQVNKGAVVTFEGIIEVNKDFGSGYSYILIMEEAKIVK